MDPNPYLAIVFFMTPVVKRRHWSLPLVLGLMVAAVVNLPSVAARFWEPASSRLPWLEHLSHPSVAIAGSAGAVILILWGIVRLLSDRDPNRALARTLERRGDFRGAAELFLRAGDSAKALRLARKDEDWLVAAESALKLGNQREAAQMYRRAGGRHLNEATRLFVRIGDADSAVACTRELAQYLSTSGKHDEAIEVWLRIGEVNRAIHLATVALNKGMVRPSAASFQAARRAGREGHDHHLLARLHDLEEDWAQAGREWRVVGDHQRSAAAFTRAGLLEEAAASELAAGRAGESARLRLNHFEQLQNELRLAEQRGVFGERDVTRLRKLIKNETRTLIPLLETTGMVDQISKVMVAAGRVVEAVEYLVAQGRKGAAAELALDCGLWELATPILEELGRWGEASDTYELNGRLDKAAICAEHTGEDERALALWRKLGRTADAARCMARIGSLQEALRLLHREGQLAEACDILKSHPGPLPDIPDVIMDLAEFERKAGHFEEGVACLQRAVVGVALQTGRLDPAVALARQLYELGEFEAARVQVDRVLSFDYSQPAALALKADLERMSSSADPAATVPGLASQDDQTIARLETTQRYEIRHELGRGGMGVVYLARDTRLDRNVAIKVLRTTSDEEAARLRSEAKAVATLNHPGIVTVYDFEAGFDGYFIAMEYVAGEPLDVLLKSEPDRVRSSLGPLLAGVAEALAYAHERQIIHRDLKPANILLTSSNAIKILDFGIAARLDEDSPEAAPVCGTPYYMAPEQIRGEPPSPATDIYSLGATAYHLATGRPPFTSGNVIEKHLEMQPRDPREENADLDEGIAVIILRCLKKDPEDRYQTCRDLARVLHQNAVEPTRKS